MTIQADKRLEIAMGHMLRIGVTIAAIVVLIGSVLYLKEVRSSTPDYRQFHGAPADSTSLSRNCQRDILHFDGESVIALGLVILVATPVCRVLFGLVGFSLEGDRTYAVVSALVLAILVFSLFRGR